MPGATKPIAYDPIQRLLHWAMAALIFAAIGFGLTAHFLPRGELRVELLAIHKSLGMTALVLVVLRVAYRLFAGAPDLDANTSPLMRWAAHAAHGALYALMIALPLSGYVNSSAAGRDIPWFGFFAWPSLTPQDKALSQSASLAHYWLAWAIGATLALHLAAVVWHAFIRRDGTLERMWPRGEARRGFGAAAARRG